MSGGALQTSVSLPDGSGEATFPGTCAGDDATWTDASGVAATTDVTHTSHCGEARLLNSKSSGAGASLKARSLAAGQVNRIVDEALPEGISASRDARIALHKCATIALVYLACLGDANRKAAGSARTTLNVQDIRGAMEAAGMAHLMPLMTTLPKRGRT
ncbi:hypothetical protein LSCM1_01836 [Leishmania martiniquensis]|uniref:Transcription factor CBF/NF-Y/archaeal histone domain-containing protein n=1 Tax=Leishmania martiniquensis TaxID=1580590 RepID=A0A836H490_9TRYP|nr:hypothetical protein LSCM1_01836 [Leishmania martiniquensis]